MSEAIILAIIGIFEGIVVSVITFFLTKKKYNTEVDSNLIENMQKSLDFYKSVSDDNQKRLDEMIRYRTKMEDEMSDLRKMVVNMVAYVCTDIACRQRQKDYEVCPYVNQDLQSRTNDIRNEDN